MSKRYGTYLRFILAILLYGLFVVWIEVYWLLAGILLIIDHYFTRLLPVDKLKHWMRLPMAVKESFEWLGAIVSALVVVTLIRTLFIEAYTIPTPSMEKSLLVGDYLFVSKLSYGPKLPNTPIAFPFTHHTLPFSEKKSYNDRVLWSYKRLRGLKSIIRNDVVVFNFPEGDTVVTQLPEQNYYNLIRSYGRRAIHSQYDLHWRPVDRRENFVKRCIALPGDTFEIRHTEIFVNHQKTAGTEQLQHRYYVKTDGRAIDSIQMKKLELQSPERGYDQGLDSYVFYLTTVQAAALNSLENVLSVTRLENTNKRLSHLSYFPYDQAFPWTEDNYGPVIIPRKGATVRINKTILPLYRRIIEVYEQQVLEVRNDSVFINGEPRISYTFGMDYFFMLGDNRHNSADSRIWGFVPEDHIVGRAVFTWLSIDRSKRGWQRFRWDKMFRKIT